MHPGRFSKDRTRPGEKEEDEYSKTTPSMLSSMDMLESGELNKLKINRE